MVDINLLGEEKSPDEENENSENISDTFSTDSGELKQEQEYSEEDELDQSIYGSYDQGTSKKAVFIVAGIIILAAISVGAYFMLGSQKEKPQQNVEFSENQVTEPEKQQEVTPESSTEIPAQPEKVAENVPPFVREMVSSSQHGVRTIEAIISSIPQDIGFTMIQYRDGDFLTEILSNNSSNFATFNNQLQRKLVNGNVRILSQDNKKIQGQLFEKALLNGSVVTSDASITGNPTYMSAGEVNNLFKQYCNQLGLRLKEFDIKTEMTSGEYTIVPVLFKASGKKDAALNFLNRLNEQNLNINLSKIVFIAGTNNFRNPDINLVLNLEIYYAR